MYYIKNRRQKHDTVPEDKCDNCKYNYDDDILHCKECYEIRKYEDVEDE